jgi:hypothetical protein
MCIWGGGDIADSEDLEDKFVRLLSCDVESKGRKSKLPHA